MWRHMWNKIKKTPFFVLEYEQYYTVDENGIEVEHGRKVKIFNGKKTVIEW